MPSKKAEILTLSNQCFTDLRSNGEHSERGDALHSETCELDCVDSLRGQLTAIFDSGHDSRGRPLLDYQCEGSGLCRSIRSRRHVQSVSPSWGPIRVRLWAAGITATAAAGTYEEQ